MPDASIRHAKPSDATQLGILSGQLGYPATTEEICSRLQQLHFKDDDAILIAERGGVVVGWIHVCVRRLLESGEFTEIAGLVVDENCRGKGIGKKLVAEAEAWARQKGQKLLRVRTNVVRTETHDFYRHLGFEEVKQQIVFLKRLS